jgi:2-hydroxychromene-2-carboxylate isomerase
MAAFRQAFAGGRDLAEDDTLAIAGAACEIHPTALLRALDREAIARSLDAATDAARAAGVRSVPALAAGAGVWHGEAEIAVGAATAGIAR